MQAPEAAMDRPHVRSLVPLAYVADVEASIAFYEQLGFGVQGSFTPPEAEKPAWASLTTGTADLMLGLASEPVVPAQQAVLFYLYCDDVAAMHARLDEAGLSPGPIVTPFYNPGGEFRLTDPDGYVVFVAPFCGAAQG